MTARRLRLALLALVAAAVAWVSWPRPVGPTGGWMVRAGVAPRFVDAAGWRVRYVRAGQGPTLVLLHGFASSLYTWSEVLPELAREHDVVAFDFPGHGGSELRTNLSAEDLVRATGALLDGLGVGRFDLVGHSLGGAVACVTTSQRPHQVRRLVLIDAAGFNLAPAERPAILRALSARPAGTMDVLPLRRPAIALGLRQVFHDDSRLTPERVDEYVAPLVRPGASAALRSLMGSRDTLGVPGLVAGIRAPTLVIWGGHDRWIDVAQADRFLSAIPGSRKVVFDDCGHMPQEERPAQVAELMREFFAPDPK
ncbi:MAG TPA: alpha/beta fold hydrolase [Vicinamibacteria bacterium]|nr:alpha/beta fold hydrolase [Vicinamibacteria bacterium]